MLTEWQGGNTLSERREWLGTVQPQGQDTEDWVSIFHWGADCDDAIAAKRAADPGFDALLSVAEQSGAAILPAWVQDHSLHPLMEMASSSDDADWVIVTAADADSDSMVDMLVDATHSILARCRYERHETPTWRIRVTYHG